MDAHLGKYTYEPLNDSKKEIRLLRLRAELDLNGLIHCEISTFDLATAPVYQALSYEWGPHDPQQKISLNGRYLSIRQNLWEFLDMFRSQISNDTLLWIDQVTIDQRNDLERGHQVRLMGDIYSQARNVIVWLGPSSGINTRILQALERHSDLLSEYNSRVWISYGECLCDAVCGPLAELCALCSCLDGDGGWPILKANRSPDLKDITELTYWDRLWIVQENVLAKDSVFFLGEHQYHRLNILRYAQIWSHVFSCAPHERETSTHIVALTNTDNSDCQGGLNLDQVLVQYLNESKKYTTPQDLVYGLLGLVRPSQRIPVDYQSSSAEVYTRVLEVLILSPTLEESHRKTDPKNLSDLVEFLQDKLVGQDELENGQPLCGRSLIYNSKEFLSCLTCLERVGLHKAKWTAGKLRSIVQVARQMKGIILPVADYLESDLLGRPPFKLEILKNFVRNVNAASNSDLQHYLAEVQVQVDTVHELYHPSFWADLWADELLIPGQAEV